MEYVDELDLSKERSQLFHIQGETLKKSFEKRHIPTALLENKDEVYAYIEEFVKAHPKVKTIAFSDGVSLYELDLYDWCKKRFPDLDVDFPLERSNTGHYAIFGEREPGIKSIPIDEWHEKIDEWYENVRKRMLCDLFIISANAVTMKGEIVSVDGLGNRVAGMIFGPRHVMCIVGRNKITTDVDAAMDRIHNYVTPLTYLRHINKHFSNFNEVPCVKTGRCAQCSHDSSACRDVVILRGQNNIHRDRIHLLVVNQDLGF